MFKSLALPALFLFNVFFSYSGFAEEIIQLKATWQFRIKSNGDWMKATVPGVVQLDLFDNGVIEDPYVGNNELKQRWIEQEDWEYVTLIDADSDLLENAHVELVFEGLDTYSTIFLNGKEILTTNNMFREWLIDIKPFLKLGKNELKIIFFSPLNINLKKVKNSPYELPAANETVDLKVSPYTRKAAYHFGWDWGPRFVTAGIWRPVYLKTWNNFKITDVSYSLAKKLTNESIVNFTIDIYSDIEGSYVLVLNEKEYKIHLKKGENLFKETVTITNAKEWNPNGYGDQNLHNINYSILDKRGNKIITKDLEIALREIELIHEKDSIGTSFYFKVNGEPFYAKGANYIPQDLFLPRVDSTRYEKLIEQALTANINMIRVWGGGIYENDYFYDLCDKHGILVWQDFMFANSMYPSDTEFKANIKAEITDNIKRLRNHPCIALWCGNNEIEVAWGNWGWQKQFSYSASDSTEIWHNYKHIFHELIPETLTELDPTRDYVPTTPLSNWGTPENFNHASMHYWGVWHGREPIENFSSNVGRFIAEYGYQSFPSYATLASVLEEKDLNLTSETMKNRQKSYIGNGIIIDNIKKYAYDEVNFKQWVELSQMVQGHAMGYAIRQHRTQTPHCMGTMFWQLNDCWPGPTWSIIDYYGNEKQSFDEVKKYYQPIIASFDKKTDGLEVTFVSDNKSDKNVTIEINIVNKKGKAKTFYKSNLTLSFLAPQLIKLKYNDKQLTRRLKLLATSHFEITLKEVNSIIFEASYYPEHNATIKFPKGN